MPLIRDFLSIGQINKPERYIAIHQHNIWELVYYTHGSGVMTVGSCQYPFEKGDIMLLPADIPHSEKSELGYRNYHMLFKRATLPKKETSVFKVSDNEGSDAFNILQLIYRATVEALESKILQQWQVTRTSIIFHVPSPKPLVKAHVGG